MGLLTKIALTGSIRETLFDKCIGTVLDYLVDHNLLWKAEIPRVRGFLSFFVRGMWTATHLKNGGTL